MSEKLLTMETAHARTTDPTTSSLAAETVPVNRHMGYVLAAARELYISPEPFTDADLITYLHMPAGRSRSNPCAHGARRLSGMGG